MTFDDHGAELVSIYDKEKDREVIWQGDPKFWGRHAPVLFPNVGKHYNNHYRIHGQEYASKQHGFARDTDFTCIDSTPDSVTHQIRSTEDTRKVYPFDFVLRIRHILKGRTLTVSWKVANNSEGDMYFAIGGHPAFNVPVLPDTKRSDYRLTFDGEGSWSLKYNLIWDKLLDLRIFDPKIAKTEVAYYLTRMNPYGIPLDSRCDYTKSDWILWCASMAKTDEEAQALIAPVAHYLETTATRVPFSDWYETVTGEYCHFMGRSVQGGIFMPVLMKKFGQ